jgi:hypothetical protein
MGRAKWRILHAPHGTAGRISATFSVFSGDNVADLVVELSNPQLSGHDDLTYNARFLEGTPPANAGACALFIDIIGMPATPMSYAGVARRA